MKKGSLLDIALKYGINELGEIEETTNFKNRNLYNWIKKRPELLECILIGCSVKLNKYKG